MSAPACTSRGFTLIELMVVVAVMAVLTTLAAPSFLSFLDRYRLEGAVENLYADLQFAKTEAVKRNLRVRLSFTTGSSWAYTIAWLNSGGTATTLKTVSHTSFSGTQISSATFGSGTAMLFQPQRGSAEDLLGNSVASRVVMRSSDDKEACVHINAVGRINICSPSGGSYVPGLPACAC